MRRNEMLQLPLEEAPFHTTELSVEAGVGLLNQITRYLTSDSILNFYSHLESFFELGNDLSMFDLEQDLTLETDGVSFDFPTELDSFNDLTFSLDTTTLIESAERLWELVSSEYFKQPFVSSDFVNVISESMKIKINFIFVILF